MNINLEMIKSQIVILRPENPFTWSSGIKSPIYCDNRLILANVELRNYVVDCFINIIKKEYQDVEIIVGTSTAGIPHATLIADRLNLPCSYVRGEAKKHGAKKLIEGADPSGKKVLIIEDLISTGGSCIDVYNALKDVDATVLNVLAIFSYNLKIGQENFKKINIAPKCITDINLMTKDLLSNKLINQKEYDLIVSFVKNPKGY